MPIKHQFQSGRGDNGDAGAVQPSHWDADHIVTGMLLALDQVAPTPNVFFSFDGGNAIQLVAKSTIATTYSPAFAGVPTAPTADQIVNSTQIATTEYVRTAITNLIGGAPGALDTLNELAAAINDDSSYAATVTAALGVRLRVDAAQGLSPEQQAQAVSNLGLANVAVSGNYADLAGRPAIGTAAGSLVQLDANAKLPTVDGSQLTAVTVVWNAVTNKPAFANVATSGSFNDLSDKPVFPLSPAVWTRKVITAVGTGTYAPDAKCKAILVRAQGAGGGGGGSSDASPGSGSGNKGGNGGSGGATLFSDGRGTTISAGGGSGGGGSGGSPVVGGSAIGGDFVIRGGYSQAGIGAGIGYLTNPVGGAGGNSPFGGAGAGGFPGANGGEGSPNSGAGGGGGGGPPTTAGAGGSGGAPGGYTEKLIAGASLSSSYSYQIGAGGASGTAGTNGLPGGQGASGLIIIEEYY